MAFEPRTLFIVLASGNAAVALALALVNTRLRRAAIGLWCAGNALAVLAWALYALRGSIPFPLSVIGGYGAIIASFLLTFAAVVRVGGRSVPWAILSVLWILSVASLLSDFLAYAGDTRILVVTASFGVAFWTLAPAVALLLTAPSGKRSAYAATSAFLFIAGLSDLYRAFDTIFSAHPTAALLDMNATQSLTFGCALVALLGSSTGFFIIARNAQAPVIRGEPEATPIA